MSAIEVRGGNCLNTHGLEALTRSFWWMRQQAQLAKSALKIDLPPRILADIGVTEKKGYLTAISSSRK